MKTFSILLIIINTQDFSLMRYFRQEALIYIYFHRKTTQTKSEKKIKEKQNSFHSPATSDNPEIRIWIPSFLSYTTMHTALQSPVWTFHHDFKIA